MLLSCSPDDLDVERHMGAVKGTFVCRSIDYLHAVLDAVVASVGEDGVVGPVPTNCLLVMVSLVRGCGTLALHPDAVEFFLFVTFALL